MAPKSTTFVLAVALMAAASAYGVENGLYPVAGPEHVPVAEPPHNAGVFVPQPPPPVEVGYTPPQVLVAAQQYDQNKGGQHAAIGPQGAARAGESASVDAVKSHSESSSESDDDSSGLDDSSSSANSLVADAGIGAFVYTAIAGSIASILIGF
ncbi:hypothetical protein H4R20_000097 [Coemansia guatemalensis]|uniref:Uncharacterized protein n=1 Tax=Coemansia guatemalensis TaxID=2761395 RepID=A0A9W8I1U8_9FUNG|nr:hypothetical protein H4R20_000097 [Coemansia guatemalensis]